MIRKAKSSAKARMAMGFARRTRERGRNTVLASAPLSAMRRFYGKKPESISGK
jgi:hypothetical protein